MKQISILILGFLVSNLAMADDSTQGKVTITGAAANQIATLTVAQGTTGHSVFSSGSANIYCYRTIPLVSGGEVLSSDYTCILSKPEAGK